MCTADTEVTIVTRAGLLHDRAWVWHGCDLLVIEAGLTAEARDRAVAEAFADLHARSLAAAHATT